MVADDKNGTDVGMDDCPSKREDNPKMSLSLSSQLFNTLNFLLE